MLGSPPWALAIATRTNPCLLAAASCQLYPLSLHIFLWHAGLPSRLAAWALSERVLCSLGVLGHAIDRHRRLLDLLVGVVVRGPTLIRIRFSPRRTEVSRVSSVAHASLQRPFEHQSLSGAPPPGVVRATVLTYFRLRAHL